MKHMIEVEVLSVFLDNTNQTPVLLLKEKMGKRVLPIWIGLFEAQAILLALKGIMLQRPLTHDLCSDTICILGGKLIEVQIYNLKEGTFYSHLLVEQSGAILKIDSRPSDSVSIALRQSCPIFVGENVMQSASLPDPSSISKKEWEDILLNLPEEAFGKYRM
jgi:bifunctional DNase/RNase